MATRYRLVAVDLDGTLLDGESRITPAAAAAVARALAAGVEVVLATGRRYRRTLPFARSLGLSTYAICQHGSVVRHLSDDAVAWRTTLPRETALAVGRLLADEGLEPHYFVDCYEEGLDFVLAGEPRRPGTIEYAGRHEDNAAVGEEALAGRPILVVAARDDWEALERGREAVVARFGGAVRSHILRIPQYMYPGLEVLTAEAGKGNALAALAARLGMAPGETAAIGDGANDVEMLEVAGLGIAMGNANEAVRRAADVIVGPNTEDGIVEALDIVVGGM